MKQTEQTVRQHKHKLATLAHEAAWRLVHAVENRELTEPSIRRCAADFLEANADAYKDENCRLRAQKVRAGK